MFFCCVNAERAVHLPLQEKYNEVASELIVYTYFFSASEEVFPEVTLFTYIPFNYKARGLFIFHSTAVLCMKL